MREPPETVVVAAGDVGAELNRRGIGADETVIVTIEPEILPGRRASRARVVAARLNDDDNTPPITWPWSAAPRGLAPSAQPNRWDMRQSDLTLAPCSRTAVRTTTAALTPPTFPCMYLPA